MARDPITIDDKAGAGEDGQSRLTLSVSRAVPIVQSIKGDRATVVVQIIDGTELVDYVTAAERDAKLAEIVERERRGDPDAAKGLARP